MTHSGFLIPCTQVNCGEKPENGVQDKRIPVLEETLEGHLQHLVL